MESFLLKVSLVFICISFSVNSRVPVYIWGKQSLQSLPPVPALEDINEKIFEEKFLSPLLQQNETLVVYSQDTFSLEDLSSQNENGKKIFRNLKENVAKQSSVLLPSVHDPSTRLALLNSTYRVKQIDLNENSVVDIVSPIEENDIIILRLPAPENVAARNKILSQNDVIIKKVQEILSKVKKPITYLYTGYSSSWDASTDESRTARHLLAVEYMQTDDEKFLNFTDCGLLYARNVTANLTKNYTEPLFQGQVFIKPLRCTNDNSSTKFEMTLDMTGVESALLTMEFLSSAGRWVLNETVLAIKYEGEEEPQLFLKTTEMDVPKGFSFSCWQAVLELPVNSTVSGNIIFHSMQVQPFYNAKGKFATSFDCVPFFTIPIWMGFLVVMLFTSILAFGIYMLFNIRNMDKFDDPKGKTISVPTGE